jgi:hypothetical protein
MKVRSHQNGSKIKPNEFKITNQKSLLKFLKDKTDSVQQAKTGLKSWNWENCEKRI